MKISVRLASGFGLIVLLFILCTGISLHALWQARDGMDDTVNNKMKRYTLVLDMRAGLRDMAIAVRNLALLNDPAQMQPEWERLVSQREAYIRKREQLQKSMSGNVSEQGKAALASVLSSENIALSTLIEAGKLGMDNQQQAATTFLMNTARPAQKTLLDALNTLTDIEMQLSRDTVAENSASTSQTAWILTVMAALSILMATGTCLLTIRVLMRQLGGEPEQARALAATIAAGDLTTTVTLRRNDTTSLMASLDGMPANLRRLVSQIQDSAASVAMAPYALAHGNTALSSRTTHRT